MLTLIVLLLYTGAVVFDLLPLKKRPKKQNILYCVLLSVSFGVLFVFSLGTEMPSASEPIRSFVQMLFNIE